jgi:hypothetical protein
LFPNTEEINITDTTIYINDRAYSLLYLLSKIQLAENNKYEFLYLEETSTGVRSKTWVQNYNPLSYTTDEVISSNGIAMSSETGWITDVQTQQLNIGCSKPDVLDGKIGVKGWFGEVCESWMALYIKVKNNNIYREFSNGIIWTNTIEEN